MTRKPRAGSHGSCDDQFAGALLESSVPCVLLDDNGKIVKISGGLRRFLPAVLGQSVDLVFNAGLVGTSKFQNGMPFKGAYVDQSGTPVPVVLEPIAVMRHKKASNLALVVDGRNFREAESDRLRLAPFVALRVKLDTTITFANAAAASIFNVSGPEKLLGVTFGSLFDSKSEEAVNRALAIIFAGGRCEPLSVQFDEVGANTPRAMRLSLIPDLAPGDSLLGAVVIGRSLILEQARSAIKNLMLDPALGWRERLRAVLGVVGTIVPFDKATFGLYFDNATLFRAMLVEPEFSMQWPERWLKLPAGIAPWLKGDKTWEDDLEVFLSTFEHFRENPVVQIYADAGIKSWVTLPAIDSTGPTSSLTLASTRGAAYGARDFEHLHDLDIEAVLLRIEADIRAEREGLYEKMESEIAGGKSLASVAKLIVDDVASFFRWDHVSIFRVNHRTEQFELLYQCALDEKARLAANFFQQLDSGMLGKSLTQGILIVDDTRSTDPSRTHRHIPVSPELRSAMTVPIRLRNRIRWILNVEALEANTFCGPDKLLAERIVARIERGIDRRLASEINAKLMEETQEGVVVVGRDGAILAANTVAQRLFGDNTASQQAEPTGADLGPPQLVAYAADQHARGVLAGDLPGTARRITLRGADQKERAVLATRRDLEDSFDTAVWFLTDLDGRAWNRDFRFLRETVWDVAQQTRGSLALAIMRLQRLVHADWSDDARADAIRRIAAELQKVDITFERLAEGLSIRKEPIRERSPVNLTQCVTEICDALPGRDRERLEMTLPSMPTVVVGDQGRLSFVIRSLLGHLLRCRPDDDSKVKLGLVRKFGTVRLSLFVPFQTVGFEANQAEPRDTLWAARKVAREDASLGLQAISKIVSAHGGSLKKSAPGGRAESPNPPWAAFEITLPSARSEEANK